MYHVNPVKYELEMKCINVDWYKSITFKYEKFVISDLNHVMKSLMCNKLRDQY